MKDKDGFRDVFFVLSQRYPPILNQKQAAEILNCSVSTIAHKFKKEELKLSNIIKEYLL